MSGSQAVKAVSKVAAPAEIVPNQKLESANLPDATQVEHPQRRWFVVAWYALNFLLVCAILAATYSVAWEYSTRRYLKGFSDAIIPLTAPPVEKVEAILNWMSHGPSRQPSTADIRPTDRDPTDTLNYDSLLQVCGSATNAFINLADSAGVPSRRLLLLAPNRTAVHVVAEVLIDGRWIIVDPAFRTIPRGSDGSLLTARQLADPKVFAAATAGISKYDPSYAYASTAHVRLSAIPHVGLLLRRILNRLLPGWADSTTVSLLLERKSLDDLVFAFLLVFFLLLLRTGLRWYGERRLGMRPVRIRVQVWRAFQAFLNTAS